MGFDDFWYDDFDGDGKIGWSDKFFSDWMYDDLAHAWRQEVEDGSEYGLDPHDFELQESYERALDEAKHEWRATAEFSFKLSPEDYETEEEYNAALAELKASGGDQLSVKDCIPPRGIIQSGEFSQPKAMPLKVRVQNSGKHEYKTASPQKSNNYSGKMKPSTAIIICVTLVLCVALGLYGGIRYYGQSNTAYQEYIDEVKAACGKYGIGDVITRVRVETGRYVNFYYVEITVNDLSNLTLKDQYKLVKELCDLDVERPGYSGITMPKVYCGGQEYDINPLDERTLQVDGKDVYPTPTLKPSLSSTWSSKSYTSSSSAKTATTTTRSTPTNKNSTSKKTTTARSDPYDVHDYSDPEEFYYYHYDDFYDYEDAEDYFNEYGD